MLFIYTKTLIIFHNFILYILLYSFLIKFYFCVKYFYSILFFYITIVKITYAISYNLYKYIIYNKNLEKLLQKIKKIYF